MRTHRAIDVADLVEAYRIGKRTADRRTASSDAVDQPDGHPDGLSPSEFYEVYRAVIDDLGGPAPDEPDYGWSDQ